MSENKYDAEVIAEYIANHADKCPECGSENIDVEDDFREYNTKDGVKVERGTKGACGV